MQYGVTHTCGHSETVNLVGPGAERDRRLAWLKTKPCRSCERATTLNAAQTATATLPALTGSEKQVAWATTIRADLLRELDAFHGRWTAQNERAGGTPEQIATFEAEYQQAYTRVVSQTAASWWIEYRGAAPTSLLRAVS